MLQETLLFISQESTRLLPTAFVWGVLYHSEVIPTDLGISRALFPPVTLSHQECAGTCTCFVRTHTELPM